MLVQAGGLRVLLQSLGDHSTKFSSLIIASLLHVTDFPPTRAYLRSGVDLEVRFLLTHTQAYADNDFAQIIISGFTSAYDKDSPASRIDSLKASVLNTAMMLKTWSGLIYLCLNEKQALNSLVQSLRIPDAELREALIDLLVDVFHIRVPGWFTRFLDTPRQSSEWV